MKTKSFIKNTALVKSDLEQLNVKIITCNGLIANQGTCMWVSPIRFQFDTGADTLVIPRKILIERGIDLSNAVEGVNETPDGRRFKITMIKLNFRLVTNDSSQRDVLTDIPCVVADDVEVCHVGLSVLNFYDYCILNNELFILRQNVEAWKG